jgi:hypothetical protein
MIISMTMPTTRRQFLTITAAGAGVALTSCGGAQAAGNPRGPAMPTARAPINAPIPRRVLGKTGAQVSILGLGAHGFPIDPVQMEVKEEIEHAMGTYPMK